MLWYERQQCCRVPHDTDVSTSRHVAFFCVLHLNPLQHHLMSHEILSVFYLNCGAALTVQLTTVLSCVLAGRSKSTVVTSVPQMHLLNAEIHISTKAKILCCMFLSCHYIVWYCKIIVCPNLHYKMFFLLKGINIATLYKGSFLDFYFFYIKRSKQWEYHCQTVYKISVNLPCLNLFLQTFHISFKKIILYYAERVYFYAIPR